MQRCEKTDLLIDQCSHCRGLDTNEDREYRNIARSLTALPGWVIATYHGICRCGEEITANKTAIKWTEDQSTGILEAYWRGQCCARNSELERAGLKCQL